jgi:hypothetical protein
MNSLIRCATTALISGSILVACGGAGADNTGPVQNTSLTGDSPQQPVADSNRWSMDSYTYLNGGDSTQRTSPVSGKPLTVVVVSTATMAGGTDVNGSNEKYAGSALIFSFLGNAPGLYRIVPDTQTLLQADPASLPMQIQSDVGIGLSTGASHYNAMGGQVLVTQDSAGKYHFKSVGALPTNKTLSVLGGVPGAPATMALTVDNVY